ncbi:MAG: (2Fe-2S)-binding protein [Myxococcota bacterium]
MTDAISFRVNGDHVSWDGGPMARLLDVLREDLRLTGSKEGCGEGECGACTVLLDGQPVCACLVPVFQVDGREVVTVEGLADGPELDAVERAFVDEGGVQCGACTPGMVVNIRALLERNPKPTRADVRDLVSGTLCRCTGYERIFRAVEVATGQRIHEGAHDDGRAS